LPNPLDRFRRHAAPGDRGREAEEEAAAWLERQGYRVLARNVRTGAGEIDVVAEEDGTLCFVEVKARSRGSHGGAISAVPPAKQRRLVRAAQAWLLRHPTDAPCRFDVLAMDAGGEREGPRPAWRYTLVRHAFEAS
jgi:putative endonuclease